MLSDFSALHILVAIIVWMKLRISERTTRKRCTGFASPAFGSMVLICTHCRTGFSTKQPLGSKMLLLLVSTDCGGSLQITHLIAPCVIACSAILDVVQFRRVLWCCVKVAARRSSEVWDAPARRVKCGSRANRQAEVPALLRPTCTHTSATHWTLRHRHAHHNHTTTSWLIMILQHGRRKAMRRNSPLRSLLSISRRSRKEQSRACSLATHLRRRGQLWVYVAHTYQSIDLSDSLGTLHNRSTNSRR